MSEIIMKRLRENEGKVVKIFLIGGFKFQGRVTGIDEGYLELYEHRRGYRIIKLSEIKDMEVPGEMEGLE